MILKLSSFKGNFLTILIHQKLSSLPCYNQQINTLQLVQEAFHILVSKIQDLYHWRDGKSRLISSINL